MCSGYMGAHCWHHAGNTWGLNARPGQVCCYCGIKPADEHGPYHPDKTNQFPYSQYQGTTSIGGSGNGPNYQNQSQQEYFGLSRFASGENPGGPGGRASGEALH